MQTHLVHAPSRNGFAITYTAVSHREESAAKQHFTAQLSLNRGIPKVFHGMAYWSCLGRQMRRCREIEDVIPRGNKRSSCGS